MKNIIILLMLITSTCFAKPSKPPYQVDLIIFTHNNNYAGSQADFALHTKRALPLKDYAANASSLYQRLSSKSSHLQREYYALNHAAQYKVLAHYSWLQPASNQRTVLLPLASRDNQQMQGTIRIRQSNYYLLNTQMLFSYLGKNAAKFVFNKTARLKANTVYYFDHPEAGVIIKIHDLR